LLCCSLPYWLIVVRRASPGTKRQVALLAVAVFVIEWAAIFSECIRPGYFDQVCANQLLQRFGRRA
jgi:hypothetical protein